MYTYIQYCEMYPPLTEQEFRRSYYPSIKHHDSDPSLLFLLFFSLPFLLFSPFPESDPTPDLGFKWPTVCKPKRRREREKDGSHSIPSGQYLSSSFINSIPLELHLHPSRLHTPHSPLRSSFFLFFFFFF
ncbi:hypothetical protein IE53DRAFT_285697 [Violaceomyces palustris]|uniref:Uncharacterized protein n=1 Tax=Violaceomyces palustris TaxID=1673888 RepID=A0ACD0NM33_9BASI|nr:hypothetical protein IE53DRAFT_285697 [Violaceomyces palustris]